MPHPVECYTQPLMTVDEIRELINLASETGIAELEVQRGENRVRIRRAGFSAPQEMFLAPHSVPAVVQQPAAPCQRAGQGESRRKQARSGPRPGEIPHRRHVL